MEKPVLAVDANIILEILANRPKAGYCLEVLDKFDRLYLSPTSIHVIYYFGRKYGFPTSAITMFLKDFWILKFEHKTYTQALEICVDEDMEDALQISACLENKISSFFTLDERMVRNYQDLVKFV